MKSCPLCENNKLNFVETIKTKEIVNIWYKQNIDILKLFKNKEEITKYECQNCGLVFFNPIIDGDDKFYSKLGENEWYYLHDDKTEFEFSNKKIKENDNILDIGSGRGVFTKYITKRINYTGLELSTKAIEYAKKDNINVIQETIQNYSKRNKETQDIVVAFQVLEHISFIDDFIQASLKSLKEEGIFIVAVPNNDSFLKYAQNNLLNLPPHHIIHWNEKSLNYISVKYNLDLVEIFKENVTNVHKNWYYVTIINKFLYSLLGLKIKSVNTNFSSKIINKIAYLISKIFILTKMHLKQNGHTIIAVYKKKKNV